MSSPALTISNDAIRGPDTKDGKTTVTFPATGTTDAPRIILLNGEIVAAEGQANKEVVIVLTLDGNQWTFTKNDIAINVTSVTSETF